MVTERAVLTPPTNRGVEMTAVLPFPFETHVEGKLWSAEYVLK